MIVILILMLTNQLDFISVLDQSYNFILETIADAEAEAGEPRLNGQLETLSYYVVNSDLKHTSKLDTIFSTTIMSESEFLLHENSSCNFLRIEFNKITCNSENEIKLNIRYLRHFANIRNMGEGDLIFQLREGNWRMIFESSLILDMRFTVGS